MWWIAAFVGGWCLFELLKRRGGAIKDLLPLPKPSQQKALTGYLDDSVKEQATTPQLPQSSTFANKLLALYEESPHDPEAKAYFKQFLNDDNQEIRFLAALCLSWEEIEGVEWELKAGASPTTLPHVKLLWQLVLEADGSEQRERAIKLFISWISGISWSHPPQEVMRKAIQLIVLHVSPDELPTETLDELAAALARLLQYEDQDGPQDAVRAPAARALGLFGVRGNIDALKQYARHWSTSSEGRAVANEAIAAIEERAPIQGGEVSLAAHEATSPAGRLSPAEEPRGDVSIHDSASSSSSSKSGN